jgi:hypothetical protein
MKQPKKYVTLKDGGCDFRKMAKIMSSAGYKMNHATARNQLQLAIESLLIQTSSRLKIKLTQKRIKEMVTSQDIQDNLADILYLAWEAIEKEEAK